MAKGRVIHSACLLFAHLGLNLKCLRFLTRRFRNRRRPVKLIGFPQRAESCKLSSPAKRNLTKKRRLLKTLLSNSEGRKDMGEVAGSVLKKQTQEPAQERPRQLRVQPRCGCTPPGLPWRKPFRSAPNLARAPTLRTHLQPSGCGRSG